MANESANAVNALPSVNLLPYHAERRAGKRKKVFMSLGAPRRWVRWWYSWAAW